MAQRMPAIVAWVSVALAVLYLLEDRNYGLGSMARPGPGLYPLVVGVVTLAFTSMTVVEVARGKNQQGISYQWPSGAARWRVLTVVATGFAYTALLTTLGELVCGFLSAIAILWVMGIRTPWKTLLTALLLAGSFHLIFSVLLGVPLPRGTLFDGWR